MLGPGIKWGKMKYVAEHVWRGGGKESLTAFCICTTRARVVLLVRGVCESRCRCMRQKAGRAEMLGVQKRSSETCAGIDVIQLLSGSINCQLQDI